MKDDSGVKHRLIKRLRPRRLSVLLTLCALVSLLPAAGVFLGGRLLGDTIISKVIYTRERILASEKEIYLELSDFIRAEGISEVNDSEEIESWVCGKKSLMVFIYDYYKQGTGAVNSVGSLPTSSEEDTAMYSSVSDAASAYRLLQSEYEGYWYDGPMEIRGAYDFPKVMRVMYFPMFTARSLVTIVCALMAFGAFALCLTLLVRRKTNYISLLSKELSVMSSGELNNPMTIKGGDELTELAKNMEGMRLSFIERLNKEEQMSKNASSLLTDMSHDLRTPLTALIGYLDILDSGRATGDEQKAKYISSAKKRAYQIKDMTDELFEYFLVYSYDEQKAESESVDALTLFSQLWDEAAFGLESRGFKVENRFEEKSAPVLADVKLIRRVIDNITSNIIKYADTEQAICAEFELKNGFAVLKVTNAVGEETQSALSSGIGLSSCEKIAELHGGRFEWEKRNGRYKCAFKLPIETGSGCC